MTSTSTTITTKTTRNIPAFFILTFILTLPIYVLSFLVPPEMAGLMGLALKIGLKPNSPDIRSGGRLGQGKELSREGAREETRLQ